MPPDPSEPKPQAAPAGVARGWRSIGFALIVTGVAGLLFHLASGVGILRSHLGLISLGLVGLGLVLLILGIVRHSIRR
jgi:hypothetical protein